MELQEALSKYKQTLLKGYERRKASLINVATNDGEVKRN